MKTFTRRARMRRHLDLHPESLRKNGTNAFVVLPYEECVALHEHLAEAVDVLERRHAKHADAEQATISLDDVRGRFRLADGTFESSPW